jgi:hypothetical protein
VDRNLIIARTILLSRSKCGRAGCEVVLWKNALPEVKKGKLK